MWRSPQGPQAAPEQALNPPQRSWHRHLGNSWPPARMRACIAKAARRPPSSRVPRASLHLPRLPEVSTCDVAVLAADAQASPPQLGP